MTDRELLELAAKAVGIEVEWFDGTECFWTKDGDSFNPLTDDGDALRLAVILGMIVECLIGATQITYSDGVNRRYCNVGNLEGSCNGDPFAATRRAIVRAAAEIGKAQGEKE